ncbi:MAG: translation initiation factor IF-2 N-terminal domain-containing protein [Gemmatimonadota bacterium]|nr:translation initiation factor IF-2 N-terminal domain-containing protein [Gemmatimonadota bacterium]
MAKTKIKTSVKTKRVYELAREFNLSSVAMVEQIRSLGFEVKNHMAICTTPMIEAVREKFDSERQATRQKLRCKDNLKKERDILEHPPRASPRRDKRLLSSKDILAFRLFILKEARKNLAQDFIKKKPEIYIPMFKYEESDVLMELAREKYIVSWLDSQWNLLENLFQNQEIEAPVRNELRYSFAEVFLRLIKKFNMDGASSLSIKLIKEKVGCLEELLNLGDKSEDNFNKLHYDSARHKRMFERTFNELKGK